MILCLYLQLRTYHGTWILQCSDDLKSMISTWHAMLQYSFCPHCPLRTHVCDSDNLLCRPIALARRVYIPLPDLAARRTILQHYLGKRLQEGPDGEAALEECAASTDGCVCTAPGNDRTIINTITCLHGLILVFTSSRWCLVTLGLTCDCCAKKQLCIHYVVSSKSSRVARR